MPLLLQSHSRTPTIRTPTPPSSPPSSQRRLALRPLLLRRHNLEIPTIQRPLLLRLLLGAWPSLLRNLAPSATRFVLRGTRRITLVHDPLVSQLPASHELLREMAAIDVVGSRVDGLGEEFLLSGETEEGDDEVLGWCVVSV